MTDIELDALRLSLSVALRSVVVSLPFAVAVAWLLARSRVRGKLLLDVLVHLPLVLPPVVVGYLLLLLFGIRGPVGSWLNAARTLGAGPWDRFFSITLPLMLPGILAGSVIAFAAGLGEFGAVITFASNIPGETRTLPLALYTALQTPGGDALAARLAAISITLGLLGLLAAEFIARRVRKVLGR
jgi:molybdate transport system permease protein